MSSAYYLPASLGAFQTWLSNFYTNANASPTTYGLTAGQMTTLNGLKTTFDTNYAISTDPGQRTPVAVANTQMAFEAVRANVQFLVGVAQASGLIDAGAAALLGITYRDTSKTPIAAPTAVPELAVEQITPLATVMRIKELGSLGNALPLDCVGYEVAMSIAPVTPPMDPAALTIIGQGTRRFFTQSYDGADVGKAAYFAVRYVTAKNLKGPWSNIITTTIVGG